MIYSACWYFDNMPRFLIFVVFLMILAGGSAMAYDFGYSIGDTAVYRSSAIGEIPIYFDNLSDTIAGIILQVELDPPGIIEFAFDDLHSYLPFDTAGTLMSGWELVSATSQDNDKQDFYLYSLANTVPPPYNPGFPPQSGGKLIILRYRFLPLPDSVSVATVHLNFRNDIFSMADPYGNSLGILIDTVITCLEYQGDSCIVADTTIRGTLDTANVYVKNGSIDVVNYPCGDVNLDYRINILDIKCLIEYLYRTPGQTGCAGFPCDLNLDGAINILDVNYLINFLYRGGPPPP
ncbi:hypothetical protein TRIP_C21581 [Candidatus Zixiibacteriota bacterium]|nr:hypothetical protein TRIP_C21581 [candidate division Zixibacteria bacterium]